MVQHLMGSVKPTYDAPLYLKSCENQCGKCCKHVRPRAGQNCGRCEIWFKMQNVIKNHLKGHIETEFNIADLVEKLYNPRTIWRSTTTRTIWRKILGIQDGNVRVKFICFHVYLYVCLQVLKEIERFVYFLHTLHLGGLEATVSLSFMSIYFPSRGSN